MMKVYFFFDGSKEEIVSFLESVKKAVDDLGPSVDIPRAMTIPSLPTGPTVSYDNQPCLASVDAGSSVLVRQNLNMNTYI
jgi:hypothetical protein